jgi:LmbE family N-acetylglucosaminyl deacetylase
MTKRLLPLLVVVCLAVVCLAALLRADDLINPPADARYKVDLLVVVAHPDDETVMGSYLARAVFEEKKKVGVVFGTRGNGGGNAEGQEQGASLSVLREIEARKALAHFGILDVWFLNGLDTPGQDVLDSLETWNHGDSLGRLVRIMRITKPEVVATWLPDVVAGENHGDHQAAGVLANEAFDLAADPTAFSEQLAFPRNRNDIRNLTEGLRPWQPKKIYFFSDAAHTEFLKNKGPAYTPTAKQAQLAAEECAYHLTQGDTGQFAKTALAKGDLHFFQQPVYFIFGKSYVPSGVTDDLFAGIRPGEIPYHRPPGYQPESSSSPRIELGGSWHFYRQFWPAHGIGHLSELLKPEFMAKFGAPFIIPVLIENPTDAPIRVSFSAELPEGWTVRRPLPSSLEVGPHQTVGVPFEVKTADKQARAESIRIEAKGNGLQSGELKLKAVLDSSAMPQ